MTFKEINSLERLKMPNCAEGNRMHDFASELWDFPRSITGDGLRRTLIEIEKTVGGLHIHSVPSGYKAFDWQVPPEWKINAAWVKSLNGETLIDLNDHPLHVMGYSSPIDTIVSREELKRHIHTLPDQPDLIPYVTSYYTRDWGFCAKHDLLNHLTDDAYHVCIDSSFFHGELNYGEFFLKGKSEKEIFFSTYVCHPGMANNELSGPVVLTFLLNWLKSLPELKYSYRAVFIPETIGSITYLSKHYQDLQLNMEAGFNVTCIGDDGGYSFLPSRAGTTLADRVAFSVLNSMESDLKCYGWLQRGSDERQYCAPGIDLPVASIMRSKYGEYPLYHTSGDDLNFVTPSGLYGGLLALARIVECLELNITPNSVNLCEPQLGRRGLYNSSSNSDPNLLSNILTFCDGTNDVVSLATKIGVDVWNLYEPLNLLLEENLILAK